MTQVTQKELSLKIDGVAFDKFLYMRDYKSSEVTMFGLTHAKDPLHVYDFALVKQKVNSASSDCCPEYMADFIAANISKGIMPINCERVWCHTHPMTGEGSANPSGKDMATWNDADNKYKNFMIMMILSRTGQMTCKLRIRSNWNKEVTGLDFPYEFEKDIKVEIIKDEAYNKKILEGLTNCFGETAVNKLGDKAMQALLPHVKLIDIYPEFKELEKEYEKLVSPDTPSNNGSRLPNGGGHYIPGHYTGGHGGNIGYQYKKDKSAKKEASAEIVPEMLLVLSEHKDTFENITEEELKAIRERFDGIDDVADLKLYESIFKNDNKQRANDGISVILGAITGELIDTDQDNIVIKHKMPHMEKRARSCNSAGMTYPLFKTIAININVGTL